MDFLSTGSVADLLGIPTHRLEYLLRDRQIRPTKGPTGAFIWTYPDVCRAAIILELRLPTEVEFRQATAGQVR